MFGTKGDTSKSMCQGYKIRDKAAGFTEVTHPTLRRYVMRIDF